MDSEAAARARSKVFVILGVTVAAAIALYFALGMPGMGHGDSMPSMNDPSTTSPTGLVSGGSPVQVLDPASFAARMTEKAAVLVNVHVPFEGDIDGTDVSVPFDKIAGQVGVLPADRDTPLLVYCRSGRMSKIATAAFVRLGYRDVVELDGGMLAWEKSGRTLIRTSQAGSVR